MAKSERRYAVMRYFFARKSECEFYLIFLGYRHPQFLNYRTVLIGKKKTDKDINALSVGIFLLGADAHLPTSALPSYFAYCFTHCLAFFSNWGLSVLNCSAIVVSTASSLSTANQLSVFFFFATIVIADSRIRLN